MFEHGAGDAAEKGDLVVAVGGEATDGLIAFTCC